jgi:hypothetical protein
MRWSSLSHGGPSPVRSLSPKPHRLDQVVETLTALGDLPEGVKLTSTLRSGFGKSVEAGT